MVLSTVILDWVDRVQHWIETLDGELQLLRWPNGLSPARPRRRSWSRMPLENH